MLQNMKDEEAILIERKFNAAVDVIRGLPKDGPYQPSQDMMLKFYGLYKQATLGPCSEPKPSFFEVVKSYKWKAWSSLGNMSKKNAMDTYVKELMKIVETMSFSENVAAFMETLGPFNEFVEIPALNLSDKNHNNKIKYPNSNNGDGKASGKENDPSRQNILFNGYTNGSFSMNSVLLEASRVKDAAQSDKPMHSNGLSNTSASLTCSDLPCDSESDDDEYSDPAESIVAPQNMGSLPLMGNDANAVTSTLTMTTCGGGDVPHGNRPRRYASNGQNRIGSGGSKGPDADERNGDLSRLAGGGGGRRPNDGAESFRSNPSNQEYDSRLFYILQKIQQDVETVALRMDALEIRAIYQHQQLCSVCRQRHTGSDVAGRSSWWPFPELSPRSTFVLLSWPLLVGGAALLLRSMRKRQLKSV